jgi:hypothetical protein
MRLSNEKARRLTALVWRERARRWLPVLVAVIVVAGALAFVLSNQVQRADRTVDVRERDGTVVSTKSSRNARGATIVRVHLDDGRDVDAFSAFRIAPAQGAHVVITEARHASGRLTYDVLRLVDQ